MAVLLNCLCVVAFVTVVAILINALQKAREYNNPNLRTKREYQEGDYIEITQKIVKYKGQTGRKIGRFIAHTNFGTNIVHIGFSVCNGKDKYDETEGRVLAEKRAVLCYTDPLQIPKGIEAEFLAFYGRCASFFKKGLPVHFELYNNETKKYEPVRVAKAVLHEDGNSTTIYHFEAQENLPTAPATEAIDEVACQSAKIIPLEQIQIIEDCEPDH